jgi:hypothetical protein
MGGITLTTRGERELALRFEKFPAAAHKKLEARINALVERLTERAQEAAPELTGRLRTEIKGRVYADNPERVAGYVQVVAPGVAGEYAKAATLEFGSDKARRIAERGGGIFARLTGGHRRLTARFSKPVQIRAYRYLRGPLEEIRPEVEAELAAALNEAAGEPQ